MEYPFICCDDHADLQYLLETSVSAAFRRRCARGMRVEERDGAFRG